ncbi:helix-turn-helix domain-containing protein [Streptomyces sp. NPDC013012]|uniref:helix-turn-helix domain-containing protein n=1 Tax=Streptomyces sp. NPDC013012 TaxID=3364860 RepID=UPI0036C8D26C
MTTDFQTGRKALGARLRALRAEAVLSGKELAGRLGWPASKISKLENGKQTPNLTDLEAWTTAIGRPEALSELKARLSGLETTYRSWRRQLVAGHRPRQEQAIAETAVTTLTRALEPFCIPGLLQTPEYAHATITAAADFRQTPRDIEDAVRARMRRQKALYDPEKRFVFLIHEAALHARTCSRPVHAAQLDRIMSVIGLDTVEVGIVPLSAQLRAAPNHGFWLYDRRLVIVETIGTEMWLADTASIETYEKAWDWMWESAVQGSEARRIIGRVRAALGPV